MLQKQMELISRIERTVEVKIAWAQSDKSKGVRAVRQVHDL